MKVALPRQRKIYDRRELILSNIKNSSVLHLGCTDSPLTEKRLANNKLLHQEMIRTAKHVVGLDVSEKDIQLMKSYGIDNLYVCDIYSINRSLPKMGKFDYIVLSEVLEHLPNAGLALNEIRKYIQCNNKRATLIITVPNINSYLRGITNILSNSELVHPDHTSYYSYSTSKNILKMSGFEITHFCYATYGLRKILLPFAYIMNLASSSFMPCIFILAKVG